MFAYCKNNPVNLQDPDGHFPFLLPLLFAPEIIGAITAIVTAVIVYGPPIINEMNMIISNYGSQLTSTVQNAVERTNGDNSPDPNNGEKAAENSTKIGNNSRINNRALKNLNKKLGKAGVKSFTKAMNKGIVGPEGQSGIKRLAPNTKVGGKAFEFEVKVKDDFANYSLYGNLDKSTGEYVWDVFDKALH